MDKIKKIKMRHVIENHVARSINCYKIANEIENIIDADYLPPGGIIHRFEEWIEQYEPDMLYTIDSSHTGFVVQPAKKEDI